MEFLTKNKVSTVTSISVDSGSGTARYLIDGNTRLQYISSGKTAGVQVINFSFSAATVFSHLLIQNHNINEMYLYYDNTDANCLFFMCSNGSINTYIEVGTITASSIQLVLGRTMTQGQEKRVGQVIICERTLTLPQAPSIKDFPYMIDRFQVIQQMPDGGTCAYNIRDNWKSKIRWRFIPSSFRDNLLGYFNAAVPFTFVLNPTSTAWDGQGYEVDWIGPFDFKPAINNDSQGYTGNMDLRQTSGIR